MDENKACAAPSGGEATEYKPIVKRLREAGYPLKIIGNDGYSATLVDVQPLLDCDYAGIYRYPGGDVVHFLPDIERLVENGAFKIVER